MFKMWRKTVSFRIRYVVDSQCSRNFSNFAIRKQILSRNEPRSTSYSTSFVRFASKSAGDTDIPDILLQVPGGDALTDKIPDPPPVPSITPDFLNEEIAEALNTLSANGEPTFASLGLGGYWPSGIIQSAMEFLHVSCDLPWWGTIVASTVVIRVMVFPLVLMTQRNSAKLNNNLPEIQTLQLKMTQARQMGNQMDTARYSQEIMLFFKEKGVNPLKNLIVPVAQAPIFISFFIGLRAMASCPVESMMHGGILWFADLTVPDQYFLLPLITSATMAMTIEVGVDGNQVNQQMALAKYFLRALPIVMIPFTINFPSAILMYWASTNLISLIQVSILKIPRVRKALNIPQNIKYKPGDLPSSKGKGFIGEVKDSWSNIKITKELNERMRVDEQLFNRAGKEPIKKTFKYDPTKASIALQAKKQTT